MNFQQLRIIRETVRQEFNLTEVANALHASQSGVSKHIKDLEDELGIELYIRKGKRLLGLTDPGLQMLPIVERMLIDANNIKNLADQYSNQDTGQLTIATTHTQARYVLPKVVTQFKQEYPKVQLKLFQGSPKEIMQLLSEGKADIGLATESLNGSQELISFPLYTWHNVVAVCKDHPLVELPHKLTLSDVAEYPIIAYQEEFTERTNIEQIFTDAGVTPDIVMTALDTDIIKSYVNLGLGIGIIADVAYSEELDENLVIICSDHLFPENKTRLSIRKGHLLRRYAYRFIEICSAELTEEYVVDCISNE